MLYIQFQKFKEAVLEKCGEHGIRPLELASHCASMAIIQSTELARLMKNDSFPSTEGRSNLVGQNKRFLESLLAGDPVLADFFVKMNTVFQMTAAEADNRIDPSECASMLKFFLDETLNEESAEYAFMSEFLEAVDHDMHIKPQGPIDRWELAAAWFYQVYCNDFLGRAFQRTKLHNAMVLEAFEGMIPNRTLNILKQLTEDRHLEAIILHRD